MSLTPSQRIKILRAAANQLQEEEWPLIDLTLTQFGLPTEARWDGDKFTYVLEMLRGANDETLNGIAEHLGLPATVPDSPAIPLPTFWKERSLKVFVSHLAAHRQFAGQLQEQFKGFGISAFVAHNDIEPTSEWRVEIERALATCDALLALLHPSFHNSNWTDQEIGFAMGRGVPVFSVRFGQDPYGFIGRFQAFNGLNRPSTAIARDVFDAYRKNKQTQELMADVLVGLLEKSTSFDVAKVRTGYLEELTHWEPSFTQRVRSAIKDNSQVHGSWGVPGRLKRLIEKWDPPKGEKAVQSDKEDEFPF